MSTTENNSRKRDSTVLDSASTDTSDKRLRINDDVEEAIKDFLGKCNISGNDADVQSFKNIIYFSLSVVKTKGELISLTKVIQDMINKRNSHQYSIHCNEENGCTHAIISTQSSKLYEGGWKNNMFNVNGVLYYENGNKLYEGEWKDDKRCGKGMVFDENGNIMFDGEWENDIVNGNGIFLS